MLFCRYDAGQAAGEAVLQDGGRLIDLEQAGVPAEVLPAWSHPDDPRFTRIVRAAPPKKSMRRLDGVRLLAPCEPRRLVMRGGRDDDLEPTVVPPGGALPAGAWSTGVAAILRHRPRHIDIDAWQEHVAGYAPFHAVDSTLSLGPWIVGADEVPDARALMFSAFLDDAPCIRPAKALLDWAGTLMQAHAERPLEAGDAVALAAPVRDVPAGSELRAALVMDGRVLARLENAVLGARPALDAEAAA